LSSFETEINPLSYVSIVGNGWETPNISVHLGNSLTFREARLSRLRKVKLVAECFGQDIVEIKLVHYHCHFGGKKRLLFVFYRINYKPHTSLK
jgi:hypothetical protein